MSEFARGQDHVIQERVAIEAVLCDLYGVLAKVQSEESRAELVRLAGVPSEEFWAAYEGERDAYDGNLVSSDEYWRRVGGRLGVRFTDQQIAELVRADLVSWQQMDADMVGSLDRIRQRYRIGLLSNAPGPLVQWLRRTQPWLAEFEFCCFSAETGLVKPQPAAYTDALARFGLPACQVLFVDDRKINCAAAAACGLPTHLFRGRDALFRALNL